MPKIAVAVSLLLLLGGRPPPERYAEVKDWPRLPGTVQLGECAGVAVDANGHVFVFHRPGRGFDTAATEKLTEPTVLEIDPVSGALLNSWGANTFLVPHGITIDGGGSVFLTDVGLQQVFKFWHDGRSSSRSANRALAHGMRRTSTSRPISPSVPTARSMSPTAT